jgi:uncharacterized iron-regulated protein
MLPERDSLTMMVFRQPVLVLLLTGAACASSPVATGPAPTQLTAFRVYETAKNRAVSFNDLIATAAKADIVFFGEQHDDPETHFAEFALLEGIGRVRPRVIVSLEMFERDVQPMVDDYLAGRLSEAEFLAKSRPWDRYATDYRGLVQLARARGWPVVASNIPRALASAIGRKGLAALDTLTAVQRAWGATQLACPKDKYYANFAETMKGHGGPGTAADSAAARAMTDRFYEAQCAKDETMGESIVRALTASPGAIVVHYNGAFHSDYGLGTAERAKRRAPGAKTVVVTAVPVQTPATASPGDHAARAEYVIFTKRTPAK